MRNQFESIFRGLFPLLWLYAWKITKNKEESEDIAIQAMSKVWDKVDNFNTELELKKYAYLTAKTGSINYINKQKAKNRYKRNALHTETEIDNSIELITYRMAVLDSISSKIEQLPPKCRQIFTLCYLHGKSRQDVAVYLNVSIDTVNSQCRIAINKLKTLLNIKQ